VEGKCHGLFLGIITVFACRD